MLWKYFDQGGLLMYPILICSIIAFMIIIERFIFLLKVKKEADDIFERAHKEILDGNIKQALKICNSDKNSIAGNIIRAGIINSNKSRDFITEAIEDAGNRELPRLERFIHFLGTINTIAPMLGLLGTVVGMIQSSDVLAASGTSNPKQVISGIAVALLTTAFGLIVAIPTLIFYNYLIHKCQNTINMISKQSDEIVEILTYDKKLEIQ